MLLALLVQEVQNRRSLRNGCLIFFFLRIQHPQRIFLQTTLTILRKTVFQRSQIINQGLTIGSSTCCIAQTIQLQRHLPNSNFLEELSSHSNRFCICRWIFRAEALHPDLVKFAQATSLRPLIAEHRAHIIKLNWLLNLWRKELVFDIRTNDRCSSFWPQRDMTVSLIVEIIHFLGHNVCCISN